MPEIHRFFATTAKEMEPLLAQELEALGADKVNAVRAGVFFEGPIDIAYRACLWSRIANRILLPLKTFPAPAPEKLYAGVKSIKWFDHLTPNNTLAVDFASSQSQITHTHFGALKVKDAIVDQFRSIQGVRPSVDPIHPDIRINVYLNKDEATLSLDLSGDSLHRRGYREEGTPAPLKENLAAALLMHAGWPKCVTDPKSFSLIDPMCGSGTIPIEAALMAADIAPGLARTHWGFTGWLGHVPKIWERLLAEARDRAQAGLAGKLPRIVGYDEDFRAVRVALQNLEKAGLRGKIHVEKRELSACDPVSEAGLIILNPPYGERMGDIERLQSLYTQIGDTFKKRFKNWQGYVLTSSPELMKSIGLKASRKIVIYNGALECRFLKYELY
jgi:23S rRNA (guanine2445-N2)-methyltransferase / 23S rRNA (guanine2069-N7)-methyltransferase